MVKVQALLKKEFAFNWSNFYGVLYIGLWKYGIMIPIRRGYIDIFQAQKNYIDVRFNKCIACGGDLPKGSIRTIAKFHKQCRKLGRKLLSNRNA